MTFSLHICKMEDAPQQVSQESEQSEQVAEQMPDNSTIVEQSPAPVAKKRGRPEGSKDKAPRKPRTKIVEEPPTPPPTPAPEPVEMPKAKPRAPRAAKESVPPPATMREMSPRSLFRAASDHIASLQTEREQARRAYWADTIARSLG